MLTRGKLCPRAGTAWEALARPGATAAASERRAKRLGGCAARARRGEPRVASRATAKAALSACRARVLVVEPRLRRIAIRHALRDIWVGSVSSVRTGRPACRGACTQPAAHCRSSRGDTLNAGLPHSWYGKSSPGRNPWSIGGIGWTAPRRVTLKWGTARRESQRRLFCCLTWPQLPPRLLMVRSELKKFI